MAIQLYVGLVTEGTTDYRFLYSIIERLLLEIANDCHSDLIVEYIFKVPKEPGSFVDAMNRASRKAYENGASILCIHADADDRSNKNVYDYKINPYLSQLQDMSDEEYCKNIIPIIPIQMIESWMMADKELLKRQINASYLSDNDLELHRNPEMYADPKQAIENAILIAQRNSAQRRRNAITIADLYEELGNMIELDSLRLLPSFQDFEEKARVLFRKMGYLE